ncbi:hypothetical protein RJT34_14449 [Clitoria ternatea]|uniref:Pectinesterase inhibitor domain-containing protein n=1 Tax=Clitoria ternatea TaxID=43366 RepID=A0AAN9PN69_CLITE
MAFLPKTLILIVLSLLLTTTHAARTPQARVWTICKPTTNPLVCFKTILPQALTGRFNIYKALEVEIAAAQQQVNKTASSINTLLARPDNSKDMAESLSTCKDQYENIVDAINDTVKQVSTRNVVEARFKFSAVLSYHSTCNDEFGKEKSPIANDAQGVYDLGGNCLDIMKAIEEREARRREGAGNKSNAPSTGTPATGPCKGAIGNCLRNDDVMMQSLFLAWEMDYRVVVCEVVTCGFNTTTTTIFELLHLKSFIKVVPCVVLRTFQM